MHVSHRRLGLIAPILAVLSGCGAADPSDALGNEQSTTDSLIIDDSNAAIAPDPATDSAPNAEVNSAACEEVLLYDDFQSGFRTAGPDATWDPPVFNDGITSTSPRGLRVIPSGTNPTTGQPAFVSTSGQQSSGGYGTLDHIKWAALLKHTSTNGFAGWDTPTEGTLSCSMTLSSFGTGLAAHPFGSNVTDPQADLRLGSAVMLFTDQETGMVFDFFVTNTKIYAVYERLRRPNTTFAAFSYAVPVANRRSTAQEDTLSISVNQKRSRATWSVNGRKVFDVKGLGTRAPDRRFMMLDHGGTPESVSIRQLNCGFGTFTDLDAALAPQTKGLVKLDSEVAYYNPRLGEPTPQTFFDDLSQPQNRLWGQGVQLNAGKVRVARNAQ